MTTKLAAAMVDPIPADEDLWDVQRAAQFLGKSTHWVYRAVAERTLPHRKVGASVRFIPAELRTWVQNQTGRIRTA